MMERTLQTARSMGAYAVHISQRTGECDDEGGYDQFLTITFLAKDGKIIRQIDEVEYNMPGDYVFSGYQFGLTII